MKQPLGGEQDWGQRWELWCLALPLGEPGATISSFAKGRKLQTSRIWKTQAREDAEGSLENNLGDLEEKHLQEQLGRACNSRA